MTTRLLTGGLALAGFAILLYADTKVDYSHDTDFSQYRTYRWGHVEAGEQLWADRIRRDIDAKLTDRGLHLVPSDPDWSGEWTGGQLIVAAFGRTKNEQTLNPFYNGFGGLGDGIAATATENTEVDALNVAMFDAQSKKLVWRGRATKSLLGNPEKNAKKLQSDINDLFKNFPPKSNS
jgi:hypothetical protein